MAASNAEVLDLSSDFIETENETEDLFDLDESEVDFFFSKCDDLLGNDTNLDLNNGKSVSPKEVINLSDDEETDELSSENFIENERKVVVQPKIHEQEELRSAGTVLNSSLENIKTVTVKIRQKNQKKVVFLKHLAPDIQPRGNVFKIVQVKLPKRPIVKPMVQNVKVNMKYFDTFEDDVLKKSSNIIRDKSDNIAEKLIPCSVHESESILSEQTIHVKPIEESLTKKYFFKHLPYENITEVKNDSQSITNNKQITEISTAEVISDDAELEDLVNAIKAQVNEDSEAPKANEFIVSNIDGFNVVHDLQGAIIKMEEDDQDSEIDIQPAYNETTIDRKLLCTTVVQLDNCMTYLQNSNYCDDCRILFPDAQQLEEHRTWQHLLFIPEHSVETYLCQMCDKSFSLRGDFDQHHCAMLASRKAGYCSLCHKNFGNQLNLKAHAIEHLITYSCHICLADFAKPELLKAHYCTLKSKPKPCFVLTKTTFECSICAVHFSSYSRAKSHHEHCTLQSHDFNQFKCEFCFKYVCGDDKTHRMQHMLTKQIRTVIVDEKNLNLVILCPKCMFPFKECEVNQHASMCAGVQFNTTMKCCGVRVSGPVPHTCPDLFLQGYILPKPKSAEDEYRIKYGMVKDPGSNEDKYKCTLCNYQIYSLESFKDHMFAHTAGEEKNFVCDVCGFEGKYRESLRRHKVLHDGYPCRKSLYRAKTKDILDSHVCKNHSAKAKKAKDRAKVKVFNS